MFLISVSDEINKDLLKGFTSFFLASFNAKAIQKFWKKQSASFFVCCSFKHTKESSFFNSNKLLTPTTCLHLQIISVLPSSAEI